MSQFNPQFEKIGNILLFENIISEDQLNAALDEQKTTKDKIGHVLIKNGTITEDDLVKAYSRQLGYKSVLENLTCMLIFNFV